MPSIRPLTFRRTAATMSTLALALGLVACGGEDSANPSGPPGGSMEQPQVPGPNDAGDDPAGGGEELLDDFPDDVPMPADYTVVTQGSRGGAVTVLYNTPTSWSDLYDLYVYGLSANGWDFGSAGPPDSGTPERTEFNVGNDEYELMVRIAEQPPGSSVVINMVEK